MSRINLGRPKLYTRQAVVTASRSIGTIFQNTTGKTILVSVSGFPQAGQSIELAGGTSRSTSPPSITVQSINQGTTIGCNIFLIVPPSFFYTVGNGGSAAPGSFVWVEWS